MKINLLYLFLFCLRNKVINLFGHRGNNKKHMICSFESVWNCDIRDFDGIFCCRGCDGSSLRGSDLSLWVEQRFLHAHFCWSLSLPGQTLLYYTSFTPPQPCNWWRSQCRVEDSTLCGFVCVQFLSRLVFKEAQGWWRNCVPLSTG